MVWSAPTRRCPPPSPAAGIADLLFNIGGSLASDQRAPNSDVALILSDGGQPAARVRFRLADDLPACTEQFQLVPCGGRGARQDRPELAAHWQAKLRCRARDAQREKFEEAVSRLRAPVRREAGSYRCRADAG